MWWMCFLSFRFSSFYVCVRMFSSSHLFFLFFLCLIVFFLSRASFLQVMSMVSFNCSQKRDDRYIRSFMSRTYQTSKTHTLFRIVHSIHTHTCVMWVLSLLMPLLLHSLAPAQLLLSLSVVLSFSVDFDFIICLTFFIFRLSILPLLLLFDSVILSVLLLCNLTRLRSNVCFPRSSFYRIAFDKSIDIGFITIVVDFTGHTFARAERQSSKMMARKIYTKPKWKNTKTTETMHPISVCIYFYLISRNILQFSIDSGKFNRSDSIDRFGHLLLFNQHEQRKRNR